MKRIAYYACGINAIDRLKSLCAKIIIFAFLLTTGIVFADQHTDDYANTMEYATSIELGVPVPGRIDTTTTEQGDEDWFKIELVEAGNLSINSTGETDTVGVLYNASGVRIAKNDDSGSNINFSINETLPIGDYFLQIKGFSNNDLGTYTIQSTFYPDDHGNSQDSATPLAIGTTTAGTFETQGDTDWFRIEVAEAGLLTVGSTGDLDTVASLLQADGTEISYNDDGNEGFNFRIRAYLFPNTTYYLQVYELNDSLGDYDIYAEFNIIEADNYGNSRETATPIQLGETSEVLGIVENEDWFRVEIPEDGVLTVRVESDTDIAAQIYNSSNEIINEDSYGSLTLRNFVENGETYYIRVTGYNVNSYGVANIGFYSLTIEFQNNAQDDHGNNPNSATPLTIGTPTAGTFEIEGDEDWFRIEVEEAGILTVGSTGLTDTVGSLLQADGTEISFNDDGEAGFNFRMSVYLSPNTTYYLQVYEYDYLPGEYEIYTELN